MANKVDTFVSKKKSVKYLLKLEKKCIHSTPLHEQDVA